MILTTLILVALADPPPLPDLAGAEPQVRAAIEEDHDALARDPDAAEAWGRYACRLAVHEYLFEAVSAWGEAQRLDPQDFRWPYLTGVYLSQDDPQAALAAFEKALELNDAYAPLHVRYAQMMERQGRPADALSAYRRAVELEPRNPYAHAGLGGRLLDDGNRDEARRHLRRALRLDPSCRPALTHMVAWHRLDGDLAEAEVVAQRAAVAPKARPPDAVLYAVEQLAVSTSAVLLRAAQLTAAGRDAQATEALRALVAANPQRARGRSELGDRLQEQGQIDLAQEQYRAALELIPTLLPARLGLAKGLVRAGRHDEARQQYESLIADHPTSDAAHSGLAVCLAAMGRMDLAVERFRTAVELAPESRRSRVGYGRALAYSGEPGAAVEVLRPVVETAPVPLDEVSLEAMEVAGTALARTGHPEPAIDLLRRVLAERPQRADIRRQLAGVLGRAGRDREAVELLREGMLLQPRGGRTALALAWILATSPDDSVRNGAAAVQLAQRWLTMPGQQRDGRRLDILACAYAEAGRFDDAVMTAERAIVMARQANKPALVEAMSARLELFKQGKPYRAR